MPVITRRQDKTRTITQTQEDGQTKVTEKETGYTETRVPNEPKYVKLYLDDMLRIHELKGWTSPILLALLKLMGKENEIHLTSCLKKRIADSLNINAKNIDNALSMFQKSNVLRRIGVGAYMANPFLIGRDKWQHVRELRMTIVYDENGRWIEKAEIKKDEDNNNANDTESMKTLMERFEKVGEKQIEIEKLTGDDNQTSIEHIKNNQKILASLLPADMEKLMALLRDPAKHDEVIAFSSIAVFLSFSLSCINQLFS